jgi:hypothetical protein
VRVDDDTLHTSRPLTAPNGVAAVVDSVTEILVSTGADLLSVELEFETSTDSDTPVGDSIAATSATPLGTHHDDGNPFDDAVPTSAMPAVQA